MNHKKSDTDRWAPMTCDIMTNAWQMGPVDLSMPDSGLDMPDVKLDALCDIIFVDLDLRTYNA